VYPRLLRPVGRSFFLFGPRGTGKTAWLHAELSGALFIDLLESGTYQGSLRRRNASPT
jgi:SpoVK/Ycf46/Vps4 family AAA+-type ATPase